MKRLSQRTKNSASQCRRLCCSFLSMLRLEMHAEIPLWRSHFLWLGYLAVVRVQDSRYFGVLARPKTFGGTCTGAETGKTLLTLVVSGKQYGLSVIGNDDMFAIVHALVFEDGNPCDPRSGVDECWPDRCSRVPI